MKPGPTGEFPDGKIRDDDEGELALLVGVKNRTVIMDFGTQVHWIGLPPKGARAVAAKLIEFADAIDASIN